MKNIKSILLLSFFTSLSGYASGLSYRGYSVVSDITNSYNYTAGSCGANATGAAYECSGVLLHGTPSTTAQRFWLPTTDETSLGGISFMFLRTDYNFSTVQNSYDKGYIIYPMQSAPVSADSITLSCAFPLQGNTAQRNAYGCGEHISYPNVSRPCQDQQITTAQQWYTHYSAVTGITARESHQCGFKLNSANDFMQVIQSAALAGTEASQTYNELMTPVWSSNKDPLRLPLQALFYTVSAALPYVQQDQRDYYVATGAFIPIIHLTLPANVGNKAVFSYADSDQVVTDVAAVLTAQYNDTRKYCYSASLPAYLCSSVIFRATNPTKDEPWKPDDKNISSGGTSFSFLRKDAKYNNLAFERINGYIIYPRNDRLAGQLSIDILCAYPIDGATDNRNDGGCGTSRYATINSEECQLQNIFTAEGWLSHYQAGGNSHTNQCGFIVSENSAYKKDYDVADAFYQTIRAMSLIASESFYEQNEMRLQTWGTDSTTLSHLPIQAFFYLNATNGLANAQKDQRNYDQTYGIAVPIVKITLPSSTSDAAEFTYNTSDQVITE